MKIHDFLGLAVSNKKFEELKTSIITQFSIVSEQMEVLLHQYNLFAKSAGDLVEGIQ